MPAPRLVILVDTSAWVEFNRATGSAVDTYLTSLIANTDEVAVTEPVIMEVVAGSHVMIAASGTFAA